MRISIAGVFLVVGVPGCSGYWFGSGGCPDPVVGTVLTRPIFDDELATLGEEELSLEECAEHCSGFEEVSGDLEDVTRCTLEEGDGDTADTGGAALLTCEGTFVTYCEGGRRPPGLRPLRRNASTLQRMAAMEAASVHAFVRLHRELTLHGAPGELAVRCLSAARDEVRHARMVARLAGGPVPRPRVDPLPLRDLDALALDNAVEGCVHETWAAVDAHLRARRGPDRATWARIAADETRHAQLAWDIDAWLAERGVARPDARRRAGDRLVAGVPRARRALASSLRGRLWV